MADCTTSLPEGAKGHAALIARMEAKLRL